MTATRLAVARLKVNEARCEALFASGLQPSDAPTAGMVAEAIGRAVQRFGIRRCAGRMAQEFGDHPDAAAERIRWVRRLAAWAAARPQASLGAGPSASLRDAASHRPAAVTEREQRPGMAHGSMVMTQPGDGMLNMNETCDRCGPAGPCGFTARPEMASFTRAGRARASYRQRCPREA